MMYHLVTVNYKNSSLMLRKECTKARKRRIYTAEPGETAMEGAGGGAGEAWAQVSTKSNSQICEKRRKGASKHTTNKKEIKKQGGRNRGDEKKATDRPMKGDPPG